VKGTRIKTVPGMEYVTVYKPQNMHYRMAETFMESAKSSQNNSDFGDFFNQKVELAEDRTKLILGEISARDKLMYENLSWLYYDLFRISRWRTEIPYPQKYFKDRTWSDLNKMELDVRDKIRRELKDSARDLSFPQKDLRESLLEFKIQNQKNQMMEGLDMKLDSFEPQKEGDMYRTQNLY